MHRTMFDTPVINTLLRWMSIVVLKLTGWKTVGEEPEDLNKFVMIAAPHTRNWDSPFIPMIPFVVRKKIYWIAKEQTLTLPFKHLLMYMGAIPLHRSKPNNIVQASANATTNAEHTFLIV